MPLFGRNRKPATTPPRQPEAELPAGEEVERAASATLLQSKAAIGGVLYLTNRRLLFESTKATPRYMIVPFADIKAAGVYAPPATSMGLPGGRQPCLFVETNVGEHVWWSLSNRKEQGEWLAAVNERASAAQRARDEA